MAYLNALICENGHTITDCLEFDQQKRTCRFCSDCGAPTLHACPECHAPVRGRNHVYDPAYGEMGDPFQFPNYCYQCGAPFPWTKKALAAAAELTDESDRLDADEKEKLKGAIRDLTSDTPRTDLAIARFRKLATKAGPQIGDALQKIAISVATEAVKKVLF